WHADPQPFVGALAPSILSRRVVGEFPACVRLATGLRRQHLYGSGHRLCAIRMGVWFGDDPNCNLPSATGATDSLVAAGDGGRQLGDLALGGAVAILGGARVNFHVSPLDLS